MNMADEESQPFTNGTAKSPMTTPGLSSAPGAFPTSEQTNDTAMNGVDPSDEQTPTPPPHKNLPQKIDPETAKAAGNKFFKAKDYDRAIMEYTKGMGCTRLNQ